ncbi:MAG: hypothetical protein Q7J80_02065, partial [Anaerolineales bacterium]|nr:hypothetical protein [Anaerolineales bacterium]
MTKRTVWLLLGLIALAVAFAPSPLTPDTSTPDTHVFRIEASQFAYTPSELSVNPGDTITIELTSTDVIHGLYVDGYDISVE